MLATAYHFVCIIESDSADFQAMIIYVLAANLVTVALGICNKHRVVYNLVS